MHAKDYSLGGFQIFHRRKDEFDRLLDLLSSIFDARIQIDDEWHPNWDGATKALDRLLHHC